ncbi:MAG: response regulator transcription factor [Clostridia bacterium]|nr:response regulator transcription factor [Clostridia bacterium]
MTKLLLAEDDAALREGLRELFVREGYEASVAQDIAEARRALNAGIDLIVLDVSLPDGDGVALCREWRAEGVDTPILFLTAKDEEFDVVRALDSGGNDYVTKPFRVQELLSRIRVLLRGRTMNSAMILAGDIAIDTDRMIVLKNGRDAGCTLTEYKILLALAQSGRVTTRAHLLEALWDVDANFIDDNTLSVHVSRLRDKIGAAHIRTVRGVGYQWAD